MSKNKAFQNSYLSFISIKKKAYCSITSSNEAIRTFQVWCQSYKRHSDTNINIFHSRFGHDLFRYSIKCCAVPSNNSTLIQLYFQTKFCLFDWLLNSDLNSEVRREQRPQTQTKQPEKASWEFGLIEGENKKGSMKNIEPMLCQILRLILKF